ncbi:MAG: hypothetical protein QOF21_2921 [Actinomycetota bacterium]|jgi:peptidoglycan/LPS O-acetylase OafA/YrhL
MNGAGARGRHHDTFDALRLIAAVSVIYGHSYAVTGHAAPQVPLLHETSEGYGSLAVDAFFAMSGFLLFSSWMRKPDWRRFARNRLLRIYPGVIACALVTVFVLGVAVTTAVGYLGDGQTWSSFARLASLWRPLVRLPGVFESNHFQNVSGSLWTLPYELLAYAALLVVAQLGVLRRPRNVVAIVAAVVVLHVVFIDTTDTPRAPVFVSEPLSWLDLNLAEALRLALAFVVGMLCATYIDQLYRARRWLIVGGAAGLVLAGAAHSEVGTRIGFAVIVCAVGTMGWELARNWRRRGDPSYGTYLYAFPIQQLLAWGGVTSALAMFALATPLAITAGYASWYLVERRFLPARSPRQPAVSST